VGTEEEIIDETPFDQVFNNLSSKLNAHFGESLVLQKKILENIKSLSL
jgi:hypothetical protein